MEPIRKEALIKATIHEIGRAGTLDVTVTQIAKRAGMSSALAHHYFGSKEAMFCAAMRHVLSLYGAEVRGALATAHHPRARLEAILYASFSPGNFRREVVSAWLNFWVLAQTVPEARRLLAIYQGRLRSNLLSSLRPLVAATDPNLTPDLASNLATDLAAGLGALIDGLYLREVLKSGPPDGISATEAAHNYLKLHISQAAA